MITSDATPHWLFFPRTILAYPFSPHEVPHELRKIQYFASLSTPNPTRPTA